MATKNTNNCAFCQTTEPRYKCPRCNLHYCSSKCYSDKKHIECSENFFKEWVVRSLKTETFATDTQHKLMKILQNNCEDVTERFKDLDIENETYTAEELWQTLTDEEKKTFERMVSDGSIGEFIDLWKPWWLSEPQLIEEVGIEKIIIFPIVRHKILKLSELTSRKPSSSLGYLILNIIYNYCFICRFFNGEYKTLQSFEEFDRITPLLTNNIECNSTAQVLQLSLQQVMSKENVSFEFALLCLSDLKRILQISTTSHSIQNNFVICVLSDLCDMLNSLTFSKDNKKRYRLLDKKLQFFMSWTLENTPFLTNLLLEIEIEISSLIESRSSDEKQEKFEVSFRKNEKFITI